MGFIPWCSNRIRIRPYFKNRIRIRNPGLHAVTSHHASLCNRSIHNSKEFYKIIPSNTGFIINPNLIWIFHWSTMAVANFSLFILHSLCHSVTLSLCHSVTHNSTIKICTEKNVFNVFLLCSNADFSVLYLFVFFSLWPVYLALY